MLDWGNYQGESFPEDPSEQRYLARLQAKIRQVQTRALPPAPSLTTTATTIAATVTPAEPSVTPTLPNSAVLAGPLPTVLPPPLPDTTEQQPHTLELSEHARFLDRASAEQAAAWFEPITASSSIQVNTEPVQDEDPEPAPPPTCPIACCAVC